MRSKFFKPFLGSLIACAACAFVHSNAYAEEVTVKNDTWNFGDFPFLVAGFSAGEQAAVWLTIPCDGNLVAVQIAWQSVFGDTGQTLHDAITIYEGGVFPTPGPQLLTLEGPVLTDPFLNEFRYIDEQNTVPINVPVTQGQIIVVSLTFANPVTGSDASVIRDLSGCQNGKNAIFAIPGGWSNSCSLGVGGDFVIRAVVDCEGTGACCFGAGQCTPNVSETDCEITIGGVYQGDGTTCTSCPQSGACCLPNGSCTTLLQSQCSANGGVFQGPGTNCASVNCPQPLGACCFMPSGCLTLNSADCATAGGTWGGAGTSCSSFDCFPEGACCLPDGSCMDGSPQECSAMGGVYQGNNNFCGSVNCPLPTGACCLSNGNCLTLTQTDCGQIPNAAWAGPQTSCADGNQNGIPDGCEPPAGCTGDLVTSATFQPPPDGMVDGADLAYLLGEWGRNPGSPADMVTSKTFAPPPDGKVDGADLAVLLGAWGRCE